MYFFFDFEQYAPALYGAMGTQLNSDVKDKDNLR